MGRSIPTFDISWMRYIFLLLEVDLHYSINYIVLNSQINVLFGGRIVSQWLLMIAMTRDDLKDLCIY